MEGGFSFCGVDIADLGLEYAPENANTYVYSPGAFDVNDESFPAHDGLCVSLRGEHAEDHKLYEWYHYVSASCILPFCAI